MKRSILAVIGFAFLISSVVGCGDPLAEDFQKLNETNMQKMCNFYSMYYALNDYQGPKDEAEFKAFLNSPDRAKNYEVMGVDPATVDGTFINPRDGQPFKIRYGVEGHRAGSDKPIVFEVAGAEGTRKVGFTSGQIREVANDQQYDEWLEGDFEPVETGRARR